MRQFNGEFWVKDQEAARQPGVLQVEPLTVPVIKTAGALLSPWREERRSELRDGRTLTASNFEEAELLAPVLIHGQENSGTPLTLLDAQTSRYGPPDESGAVHHFRGGRAIVGGHLRDRDREFTGYRIRLSRLEAWRPLLLMEGWALEASLAHGETLSIQDVASPGQADPSSLWITVQNIPPSTLRELDRRFLRPLLTLFTLATDVPCAPLAIQVQEEPSDGPWWDVYSMALHANARHADLRWEQPRWLLQAADVGLRQLAAWLDEVEKLGPLPAVVADLAHASTISLDTQVLLLTTVAEGLHRRLYPDDRRFDEQTGKDVQAKAAAAVSEIHPKAEEAVRGLLNYVDEVGYTKRLARLAEAVKDAVPGVTGNTSKWKAMVFEARNEYAHRLSAGFLDDTDIDRRQTVTFSLRWLFTGLLLLHADITPALLAERFTDHEQYWRFLADARQWQPQIYKRD